MQPSPGFIQKPNLMALLLHTCLPLSVFLFVLLLQRAATDAPYGTIERTVKQQVLATIPPGDPPSPSVLFLSSPSGKYASYFLRAATVPAGGGFGNDFCFVQVVDTASGESAWESECAPVSSSNACSLVFDDDGLDVFDGSRQSWSAEADGFHPRALQLVDIGDMRIIDKEGELAWRAADDPRRNQGCGLPGSPGLSPETPPFAGAIGSESNLPFGQQGAGSPPQVSAVAADSVVGNGNYAHSAEEPPTEVPGPGGAPMEVPGGGGVVAFGRPGEGGVGLSGQPLVDNTPYDSGCLGDFELSVLGMVVGAIMVIRVLFGEDWFA
ncbi:hypothetical protein HPP92_022644 [Vanilla planifolia]|uniref:Uncharacterized protein n=1 Tax=Vanilla planifolia TaxID=51239 RepID=A0A835PTX3_VANPL|nr:hypothetical protein HPP92_022644 [Vanilla planifolia]